VKNIGSVESAEPFPYDGRAMKVQLHHPARETVVKGPKKVEQVLRELKILPDTVLVIRADELIPEDEVVADSETIEIRPVISGG
jgi:sulfur carrier protein